MDVQALLKESAHRIERGVDDLDALVDLAADASFVLLGETSHGTHEFYAMRAEITKRLIREKVFQAVAAEADWPDAYRVNEYVRGRGNDRSVARALSGFTRFPVWMWRNRVVEEFAGWLRAHNESRPEHTAEAGFYGLDLYSMNTSREAVMKYLDGVDPDAAKRARYRY